jgi:plastocyanin domain-containing protein
MSDIDPREAFNPVSTVNLISGFMTVLGLLLLGFASYSIAKQHKSGKDSTPARIRALNILWSMAYGGVLIVLLGFAMAYAYD